MKKFLNKYSRLLLTSFLGVCVFLFWRIRYPFALTFQEQFQLFLFDDDYFLSLIAEPGGFAKYVAEFLVQFYNSVTLGATILAILMMLVQRLTWRLMCSEEHYMLSFIPVAMLWYAMGDENVMLTYVVALVMALAASWFVWGVVRSKSNPKRQTLMQAVALFVLLPLFYWLLGPMVLLVALCVLPVSIVWGLVVMVLSSHFLPFPLSRVMLGIDYYRSPEVVSFILIVIPAVIWVLTIVVKRLPKPHTWVLWLESLIVTAVVIGCPEFNFDTRKYELIEYDYLVRIRDWQGVIAKAEKKLPDLPMSVSATNLALAMTNQLGERAFDFYQRGSEGMLPGFERNYATIQLTGEIYFFLGLVNTAQRLAFESMEAIPNYNKSARVVKRLAETNLINGQYKVAEKYLKMLEKTIFYRSWAERTKAMLGDEKAINEHPLYGTLRKYQLKEDFLFSDIELDKICGQLFMHNHENQMAAQYLLMMPLLDRDIPRFMQYAQYVQSQIKYNPRCCQEAIAFAFMQQNQPPPQGVVSPLIVQRINEFARIYSSGGKDAPGLEQFRNTAWYYLTSGK